ncbi:hypothetical protein [Pseudomonas sp. LB3P14]
MQTIRELDQNIPLIMVTGPAAQPTLNLGGIQLFFKPRAKSLSRRLLLNETFHLAKNCMRKRLRKQIYLTRVLFDQVTRGAIIGSDPRRKTKKAQG